MGAARFRHACSVAPPADFHRPSRNFDTPIGVFDGQSDIGSALLPGSASYEFGTKRYTVNSAGYKVWYTRDEFRYLWKKMSGDVSLAAGIQFPDANGYGDRRAVLIIRQDLDDDSTWRSVPSGRSVSLRLAHRHRDGFCSHVPDKIDTAALSGVVLQNSAGKIH